MTKTRKQSRTTKKQQSGSLAQKATDELVESLIAQKGKSFETIRPAIESYIARLVELGIIDNDLDIIVALASYCRVTFNRITAGNYPEGGLLPVVRRAGAKASGPQSKATSEEVAAFLIDFLDSPACTVNLHNAIVDFFDDFAAEANIESRETTRQTFPLHLNIIASRALTGSDVK